MYSVNLYGDNSRIIRVSLNYQILLHIGRTYKQNKHGIYWDLRHWRSRKIFCYSVPAPQGTFAFAAERLRSWSQSSVRSRKMWDGHSVPALLMQKKHTKMCGQEVEERAPIIQSPKYLQIYDWIFHFIWSLNIQIVI